MKLGLDVSALCLDAHRVRGIGRYTEHLVSGLLTHHAGHEYACFANGAKVWSGGGGADAYRLLAGRIRPGGGPLANFFANQWLLPFRLLREDVETIHFPTHLGAPAIGLRGAVVTVLDVIQHLFPSQYLTMYRSRLYMACAKRAARKAASVITISEASKRDIVRTYRLDPSRVTVTPLGVDAVFRPHNRSEAGSLIRRQYGIEGRFILYVGGFDFRKNLAALVSAFERVRRHHRIRLVIVGKKPTGHDPSFSELMRTIESAELSEHVILVDFVPNEDLALLYSMTAAFVFPSLYEGFGLPLLEAMACGAPVVAYNRSSMPEVVGDAGILVDELHSDALADAVHRVLSNPELAGALREKGLARAAEFTWDRTVAQTMSVYLAGARPRDRSVSVESGISTGSGPPVSAGNSRVA